MKHRRIVIWLFIGVLLIGSAAYVCDRALFRNSLREYEGKAAYITETLRKVESTDKVTVYLLDGKAEGEGDSAFPIKPYGSTAMILDEKILVGSQAEAIIGLWTGQQFGGYGALCHDPVFGLRFYRGWRLIMETSVCFRCHNFYAGPGSGFWWGFDASSPKAQNLLAELYTLFPEAKK